MNAGIVLAFLLVSLAGAGIAGTFLTPRRARPLSPAPRRAPAVSARAAQPSLPQEPRLAPPPYVAPLPNVPPFPNEPPLRDVPHVPGVPALRFEPVVHPAPAQVVGGLPATVAAAPVAPAPAPAPAVPAPPADLLLPAQVTRTSNWLFGIDAAASSAEASVTPPPAPQPAGAQLSGRGDDRLAFEPSVTPPTIAAPPPVEPFPTVSDIPAAPQPLAAEPPAALLWTLGKLTAEESATELYGSTETPEPVRDLPAPAIEAEAASISGPSQSTPADAPAAHVVHLDGSTTLSSSPSAGPVLTPVQVPVPVPVAGPAAPPAAVVPAAAPPAAAPPAPVIVPEPLVAPVEPVVPARHPVDAGPLPLQDLWSGPPLDELRAAVQGAIADEQLPRQLATPVAAAPTPIAAPPPPAPLPGPRQAAPKPSVMAPAPRPEAAPLAPPAVPPVAARATERVVDATERFVDVVEGAAFPAVPPAPAAMQDAEPFGHRPVLPRYEAASGLGAFPMADQVPGHRAVEITPGPPPVPAPAPAYAPAPDPAPVPAYAPAPVVGEVVPAAEPAATPVDQRPPLSRSAAPPIVPQTITWQTGVVPVAARPVAPAPVALTPEAEHQQPAPVQPAQEQLVGDQPAPPPFAEDAPPPAAPPPPSPSRYRAPEPVGPKRRREDLLDESEKDHATPLTQAELPPGFRDPVTGLPLAEAMRNDLELRANDFRSYAVVVCQPVRAMLTPGGSVEVQASTTFTPDEAKIFATKLQNSLRQKDSVGRYDSQLFLLFLPRCKVEETRIVIDRVRSSLLQAQPNQPAWVDISYGAAAGHVGEQVDEPLRIAYADLLQRNDGPTWFLG